MKSKGERWNSRTWEKIIMDHEKKAAEDADENANKTSSKIISVSA